MKPAPTPKAAARVVAASAAPAIVIPNATARPASTAGQATRGPGRSFRREDPRPAIRCSYPNGSCPHASWRHAPSASGEKRPIRSGLERIGGIAKGAGDRSKTKGDELCRRRGLGLLLLLRGLLRGLLGGFLLSWHLRITSSWPRIVAI